MIGIIVISESKASFELLKTVKKAMGRKAMRGFVPLAIRSNFTRRTLTDRINHAIRKLGGVDGILILSEIYGSTQTNVCLEFLQEGLVELVSGYNLSMLLKAASLNQTATLKQLSASLQETGKKYILSFRNPK